MPDMVITTDFLKKSLQPYLTPENKRRIINNLIIFSRIIKESSDIELQAKPLLSGGVIALQSKEYWLQLEIDAQCLSKADDILFRRCLISFASALNTQSHQPSMIKINSQGVNFLDWYRKSRVLGDDINKALFIWDQSSQRAPISRLSVAYDAIACLRRICEYSVDLENKIITEGFGYFTNAAQYNYMFENMDIGVHKKAVNGQLN